MALEFKKPNQTNQSQEIGIFDIAEHKTDLTKQLINTQEIDNIVSTINVYDMNSVVTFGAEAAEEISKCSDQILANTNIAQVNDSGQLLNSLGKIMDQFDINELEAKEPKNIFDKLFNNVQKQLDQILAKYNSMGNEVDKIYVQLKKYESEIHESNKKLETIFESNVDYYKELVKYILAGEQAVQEIDEHLAKMNAEYDETQDNLLRMDITNIEQAKDMLEQRIMDLRMAENVAIQAVPMVKTMQYSNSNLVRKINSAFIITLPVFKQGIAQAVLLKRQRIQAQAMKALDERTNEMLLKNAKNTAEQAKLTARLASGSSVKIETLEQTWKTIVNGIDETKQIQEEGKKKREEDIVRLNALKEDYRLKMSK